MVTEKDERHLSKYKPETGHWKLETSCKSCQISFCCGAGFVGLHPGAPGGAHTKQRGTIFVMYEQ